MIKIVVLNNTNVDANIQNQVFELFKQLSPNKRQSRLDEILTEDNKVTVLACFSSDRIVGIASMAVYRVISGRKGWIEDVVVDKEYRGMGIGRILIEKLLAISSELQLSEVLLFTEEHRTSAIELYQKLGFNKRDSNNYILKN
ncbi:GNAT family N-acetyltransferase [Sphingobacterium zeae]|uniref:GNAT family N-acetyltransferase n=1 Tax=Sphingobacterium zeae TaxID=1776859 RepID=UPI0036222086